MNFTYLQCFLAIISIGALMLLMRGFAFIIFAKKDPPEFFKFIEKYIPALSIAVLSIVCLKEKTTDLLVNSPSPDLKIILPALAGSLLTVVLHIWKNNSMVSIFSGTILYMVLSHLI